MCGIVGLAGLNTQDAIRAMNTAQSHRGPDGEGYYADPQQGVQLAMRRLAIIDLETGQQPMSNEDGSIWVVCNGEIYNSAILRDRLAEKGHRFKTNHSDVETLVHLYEEYETDLVRHLNGMFAFVIYDKKKKRLFGARDRTGIKPLYYAKKQGKFAFSSELKSMKALTWISEDIDPESLWHYLSLQYIPAPRSIFSQIHKLPAGHAFTYDIAGHAQSIWSYWDIFCRPKETHGVAEWQALVKAQFLKSLQLWTLSDVPIACSLSGGLDSAAVIAGLSQLGIHDLRTYSLGFTAETESSYNELPLARALSQRFGTRHHEYVLDSGEVLRDLPAMVTALDEPYGGGLPSWYIYRQVAKDVKVLLTGTGGDELFGNYEKYRVFERPWYQRLGSLAKRMANANGLVEALHHVQNPMGYWYPKYMTDAQKRQWMARSDFRGDSTEALIESEWRHSGATNPRDAIAYIDFRMQLPEEFLMVTDRFSMAHSVEARTPFLDHPLVELIFSMPADVRVPSGPYKSFFRQMVADWLPTEYMMAPKRGFTLPLKEWTRGPLRSLLIDHFSPSFLQRQGIFSPRIFQHLVQPHLEGKRDLTQQVWTLMMFQLWHSQLKKR